MRRIQSQAEQFTGITWGGHKMAPVVKNKDKPKPPPIQRDDIRLIQPEESGLEYPVVGQWNEEHGSWDVLKPLEPRRKRN